MLYVLLYCKHSPLPMTLTGWGEVPGSAPGDSIGLSGENQPLVCGEMVAVVRGGKGGRNLPQVCTGTSIQTVHCADRFYGYRNSVGIMVLLRMQRICCVCVCGSLL
jgi:hypothetical protein